MAVVLFLFYFLTRGGAHIIASDTVPVLQVLLTPGLSVDKHLTTVSANYFFHLWQLHHIRHSLLSSTLFCLAESTTVAVFWSMRRRRRPTSCSVFSVLRPELSPTLASTVERWFSSVDTSFIGWTSTTRFGSECASSVQVPTQHGIGIPVDTLPTHVQRFWSLSPMHELDFLRINLATYGGRAFACASPAFLNSLPDSLKNINLTLLFF